MRRVKRHADLAYRVLGSKITSLRVDAKRRLEQMVDALTDVCVESWVQVGENQLLLRHVLRGNHKMMVTFLSLAMARLRIFS